MQNNAGAPQTTQRDDRYPRFIRASELARWAYCHRAWWLEYVRGYAPMNLEALAKGRAFHEQHGRSRAWADYYRRMALWMLFGAVGLFLMLLALVLFWLQ